MIEYDGFYWWESAGVVYRAPMPVGEWTELKGEEVARLPQIFNMGLNEN